MISFASGVTNPFLHLTTKNSVAFGPSLVGSHTPLTCRRFQEDISTALLLNDNDRTVVPSYPALLYYSEFACTQLALLMGSIGASPSLANSLPSLLRSVTCSAASCKSSQLKSESFLVAMAIGIVT